MGPLGKLKRQIISQLLGEEDHILIVVDPGVDGVKLPSDLLTRGEPVALHIGYRMVIPIPDLQLDDAGVTGTLSFNRTPFPCMLPWACLVQVSVRDEHLVWLLPTSAPPEGEADPAEDRPKLRLV
jgi:hypothetical protein